MVKVRSAEDTLEIEDDRGFGEERGGYEWATSRQGDCQEMLSAIQEREGGGEARGMWRDVVGRVCFGHGGGRWPWDGMAQQ